MTTVSDETALLPSTVTPWGEAERVAHYRVLERIGAGGMGEVFAAYDEQLRRKVALKVVRPDRGGGRARERLRREAVALAQLNHPNVVTVHGVHEHEGNVLIAMEFVDGQTLGAWAGDRPWTDVLDVFLQAGEGLAAAHERGLLHRDFKPDNVMVGDDGRPRVMDFGLVLPVAEAEAEAEALPQSLPPATETLTSAGALVGTLAYMAPEQHRRRRLDARADQFSLCVALYEALYGRRPFEGATHAALLVAMNDRPRSPPPETPVPAPVWRVIERGLQLDPEHRHRSVPELLAELRRAHRPARRSTVWVGMMGVVGAVGAVWWAATPEAPSPPPCQDRGAEIQSEWDTQAQGELRRRFSATSQPYAAEAASRVITSIDRWTARWSELRTEACVATRVEQTRSEAFMDRQLTCLHDRRRHLVALVEQLRHADDSVVRQAVEATNRLPSVESCADPVWLDAQIKPPEDPHLARSVEALHEALARARAQRLSARYEPAERGLDAAMEQALSLGFRPAVAEVRFERGLLLEALGRGDAAIDQLRRAYLDAGSVGDDGLAYRASSHLVFVYSELADRHDDALEWAEHARMAGERAAVEGTALEVDLLHSEAALFNRLGRYDHALA
ncbi:MAG: serine/threonine protein kinase, partial [Deltaproteobacteria bacterium]|nr:serine/threonine protein kinase [Deltaproteobacteria bacterium]